MAGEGVERGLRFAVLGPVRAWRSDRELDLGTPLQRSILAMLLLREGMAVTPAEMIDGVWGEDAPPRALGALRTYVSRLRAVLEPERSPRARPRLLVSVGGGYALRLPPEALDLSLFERDIARAEAERKAGRLQEAAGLLRAAMARSTGEPLAGAVGPYADHQRDRLIERRMTVMESLIDVDLSLGRHNEIVPDLIALTAEHPLRERLRAQLMLAYYRCGRQAEALAVFTDTRRTLVEELGVDPGPELTELHRRILAGDPTLALPSAETVRLTADASAVSAMETPAPAPADGRGAPHVEELPRPAQLPATVADFTGRREIVARLRNLLADSESMPVAAISGIGGVGKTTLAVHVAHSAGDLYPDGQLYADLRGHEEERDAATDAALGAFLRALGIPADIIPEGRAERSALYRSLLADRRMLVLLDNAGSTDQVTPLLPGTPGCAAIVTSRIKLADLPGARLFDLDVMEPDEALELFAAVVGTERVSAERAAAMDAVAACGFLPLAVRILAARLASRPAWTISSLVSRLADERRRLDELRVGSLAVDATFALGYGQLDPAQARAFRLLSLAGGPDISLSAASTVLGLDVSAAENVLESLVDASLLESPAPNRYRSHDLLKLFARRAAETEETFEEREAASARLLDFYLASAKEAHRLAYEGSLIHEHLAVRGTAGRTFATADEAVEWLAVEAESLFAAIGQAAESAGRPDVARGALLPAADLLVGMEPLLESGTHAREFERHTRQVLATSQKIGDGASEVRARYVLGRVLFGANRLEEAEEQFRAGLNLSDTLDERIVTGEILNALGVVAGRRRRHHEALAWFDAAREFYRKVGAPAGEALVLSYSARDHLGLNRPDDAIAAAEQGLAIFTELGSGAGIARARYHLGIVLSRVGRLNEAVHHHAECLSFFRAGGQRVWEQRVRCRLAETFIAAGRFTDAVGHAEQALTLSREIGYPYGEAQSFTVLGRALAGLGDTARSDDCFRRAHALFTRIGAPEADDLRAIVERDQVNTT
ncbi:AfsR/SARP family transcriptional regulator [Thermostaphylospora chromogena]|uniref:DNA-binding transcriptional activator of the SARP family n=1 Tax=Thermostaphylospora chromogena TaxID=35622 RepID=A0A1H1CCX0_9ACTN|nr:AfsR/SARP family transcriptional regulator [Thermostaphylospora chromogena]SDQ62033.1 DNA-binding transcriptional activator of the SARP family [Thermostaphylospora chromogena]